MKQKKKYKIKTEQLSSKNISKAAKLIVALWPDCNVETEHKNCKRILSSKKERIQIAKVNDKYVGFIHVNLRMDYVEGTESTPVAYIEGLYVKPKHRMKGIGEALVKFGEKWAKKKGVKEFGSDTELVNTDSIAFHKRLGFEEVNRIVCFAKKVV